MIQARWAGYRLFDYERELARRELAALTGGVVDVTPEGPVVRLPHVNNGHTTELVDHLAARATFLDHLDADGLQRATAQGTIESCHWHLRGRSRRRQATRFGVHGLHEYRGKFNPQMARALINATDPQATVLLDPFCGSGTTLIEGLRLGLNVLGVDRSPMAHFLASVKVRVLRCPDPDALAAEWAERSEELRSALAAGQRRGRARVPAGLSEEAATYLRAWFTAPALAAIFRGLAHLEPHRGSLAGDLAALGLSAILRDVSLQLPEDLRVRRRPPGFEAPSLADRFAEVAERTTFALEEVRTESPALGSATIELASAGDLDHLDEVTPSGRRLIVTSPPYATALPYIDTDRLSLVALGLAQPAAVSRLEGNLIGSREWNRAEATSWETALRQNTDRLPAPVLELLAAISDVNAATGAGFRRAAVPALLYRYFVQIGRCMDAWSNLLRRGERAVLVVGRNRTGPPEQRITIQTPALIGTVAEMRGFQVDELVPLETWPRYGLHRVNGVNSEEAVVLTRR